MEWIDVADSDQLAEGQLEKLDIMDREITLARINGEIYAFDDRCPHMNAPLHKGRLDGHAVICPMHRSRFDLRTGKLIDQPRIPVPKAFKVGSMMAEIRTHDLQLHEVQVIGGRIRVRLSG